MTEGRTDVKGRRRRRCK